MNYTPLQENIFKFVKEGQGHGIIDACAGSGKTTTIIACAEHVKDRNKTLFCAFNRSIRIEIEAKFRKKHFNEITVKTMHALGFDILKSQLFVDKEIDINKNKLLNVVKSYKFIQEYQKELTLIYNITEKEKINDEFWERMDPNNAVYNEDDPYSDEDQKKFYFFRLPKAMQDVLQRVVDINMRYRLTLCKSDKDSFEQMLDHFGFPISNVEDDEEDDIPEDVAAYLCMANAKVKRTTKEEAIESYYTINSRLMKADLDLARYGIIDFVDMLYLPSSSAWNLKPDNTFEFIFVDECQDLSKAQLEIARKYCSPTGRILAVGDPQQSIYGFAGADSESFSRIRTELNAKELPLSDCFRCPQDVITLAKKYKPSITGVKPEAGIVSGEIEFHEVAEKVMPGNMILSRTRDSLIDLLFELIDKEKKCYIHHDNVEEIIEELKNIFTKQERVQSFNSSEIDRNIKRVMLRLEKKTRAKYFNCNYMSQEKKEIHINDELEKLNARVSFIFMKLNHWEECSTITDVLITLKRIISDKADDAIKMSTVHRAKGLENDVVYLIGANTLPKTWEGQKEWERIQEENLTYVAYTRAKKELYLVPDPNNIDEDEYERRIKGSFYSNPGKNFYD